MAQLWSHRLRKAPGPRATPRHSAGFTLLEVLVALAVAVPALALLYRQGGLTLELTQSAGAYQEAISRARSRLDGLSATTLTAGVTEGDDGGGFHWRTSIAPIATLAMADSAPRDSLYAKGTTLFAVEVQLSWPGSRGPQLVTLDTRRLGPAAAR